MLRQKYKYQLQFSKNIQDGSLQFSLDRTIFDTLFGIRFTNKNVEHMDCKFAKVKDGK